MPSWLGSLQFRLILAFTLTLALALGAVGVMVSLAAEKETDRFQARSQEFRLGRVHRMIAHRYAENMDWAAVQPSLEQAGSFYGRRFLITDDDGQVVADSHPRRGKTYTGKRYKGRSAPIVLEGREVGALVLVADNADSDGPGPGRRFWGGPPFFLSPDSETAAPFNGPGPAGEPLVSRVASAVNKFLLWTGVAAAIGGILLTAFASRRILAPLQTLGGAAQRLGEGDLSQRVPASGPSEIRQLGNTFNVMAENLQAAEQQRRNLTADVAHELRTPLSNIQGYLDAVNDGLLQPDEATMAALRQQTAHLVTLVEDLRLLALAEAGSLVLQTRPESLQSLLEDSVEAFRPRAEVKNIRLTLDAPKGLPDIELDRTRIAQAVGNLIENAFVNTPEGGAVTVSAEVMDDAVTVSVADTGPGIAPEDLERVFDRFYRVDPSRARSTGGAGLGLTIARQLVEAHGGAIRVESRVGEGATFYFDLPLPQGS
jgi:signal transduction histidine kinase